MKHPLLTASILILMIGCTPIIEHAFDPPDTTTPDLPSVETDPCDWVQPIMISTTTAAILKQNASAEVRADIQKILTHNTNYKIQCK